MKGFAKTVVLGVLPQFFFSALHAETISVSLGDPAFVESSTAVINPKLNLAHPPLQVQDWDGGSGPSSTPLQFGSGIHGPFNASTYLNFHDGVYNNDGVIKINTDLFPVLDVTEFHLESGWVIRPTGSNPLVIRCLSNVEVHGIIDCSGDDGEDLSDDLNATPSGGLGRCGGSHGGRGGSLTGAPDPGEAPSTNLGAAGGAGTSEGSGGGGGGGMGPYAPPANPGLDLSFRPAGIAGVQGTDKVFDEIGGGAGGGGGQMYNNAVDPATLHATGGGGGAGGGSIYIHAVKDITITGQILANGGKGGGSASARKGGSGGGGAGGSVQIFAGGELNSTGLIEALGGNGGTSGGGMGGKGGAGRTWATDARGMFPFDLEPIPIIDVGKVSHQTGLFEIVSKLINIGSDAPDIKSVTLDAAVSGGSSVDLEVAFGDTPFDAASVAWQPAASLSLNGGKRYLRFRVRINNQSATQPVVVRSVKVEYGMKEYRQFEFASCQAATTTTGGGSAWIWLLSSLAPLLLWVRLRIA